MSDAPPPGPVGSTPRSAEALEERCREWYREHGTAVYGYFRFHVPSIDVAEQDGYLVITAELPGMKKEEVELQIENGVLTIRGEKKQEKEKKEPRMHVFERTYGLFERAFALPQSIDLEKVKAEFENGVLTITVPKLAQEKGRKLQIVEK